jgi:hypothetical protein
VLVVILGRASTGNYARSTVDRIGALLDPI